MPDAPRPRRPNDPIPETLEEIEADIDHWTGQLSECSMGSECFNAVEVRLRQLARAKERSPSPRTGGNAQVVAAQPSPRRVFVVHGRNLEARDAMFTFLQSDDLDPIEWSEAVSFTGEGSPFIGQVLDRAFSEAKAVVVLITGDDLARLDPRFLTDNDADYEKTLTPQARPNVLFEAGMAFGRYPERTILVSLGRSRAFSDVAGRAEVRVSNRAEDRQALVARLKTAGCDVKTENRTRWLSAGDFDAAVRVPDTFLEPEASVGEAAAIAGRVPNLTGEQKTLLRQIVGVYVAGCHSPFILCETDTGGASLLYGGPQPDMEVHADETDFQRLAMEQLLDLTRDARGGLRGKPTALGIKVDAVLRNARVAQQSKLAKLVLRVRVLRVANDIAGELMKLREFFLDEAPELLSKNQEFFDKWPNDTTISLLAETRATGYWTKEKIEELYRDLDSLDVGR
jgi:predicted nucleotide-binding protein